MNQIDIEIIIWICSTLCVIVGVLITALVSVQTRWIRADIQALHRRIDSIEDTSDKALELHGKHLKEFHTT